MLINGINANKTLLKSKGINVDKVETIATLCNLLTKEGEKLDAMADAISKQRKACHIILDDLKNELSACKTPIKERFNQELWMSLGIADKRL